MIVEMAPRFLTWDDVDPTRQADDGNACSAFLTVVFILAREGIALDAVGLLRRVTFQADDPQAPLFFVRYINILLAENRRRTDDAICSASS
ncbi:hypothetical protein ACFRSX_08840 [Streptomyces goshikiensis]|uniref:hypothetical protein n=1 Tax=Streptomyces TaxID=1883 RepID=UPI001F204E60|nr:MULTISPECIES: hypothetical protein [unclassified Streptomyces]